MTQNQTSDDKRIYLLSKEKPAKAILKLGVPLIAGMFIMVLYNLVDTYFIGLMRDDYQLAAVNLAYPVMMISIAISNMIGTGASSLIARSLGADDRAKAEHTLTAGLMLTVLNSLIVTVLGLLLLPAIVNGLGAQDNTREYTRQYVIVLLTGSIFTMGNYTLGQLLRSEGSVKQSVFGMIVGTIVNIILDPIFIFTLGMEIKGAAIATILGNAAGMAVSANFYLTGKTLLKPAMKYLRPTAEILKEIFWVGVPATLETLLTSAAYIVNNNLAVAYGELTVAAMGVAQKILSLGNYIYQGFASGTQPIMGFNYGAKNYRRMMSVLRSGLIVVTATELCVMTVYGIFAPWLIGFFLGFRGSDRHGEPGVTHHHVHPSLCRRHLHEPDVLPGYGQTTVRLSHHADPPVSALCAASSIAQPSLRVRRHDLGTACNGGDHDGRSRDHAVSSDPVGRNEC